MENKLKNKIKRKMENKIEIMAPAGSCESLMAAIKAGANSVYFGVGKINMRAHSAANFTVEDIKKIAQICEENNVKSYLTVNTILYDEDLTVMRKICNAAKSAGITAVIASDIAAMQYAKSIGLEAHISTQANVTNIEAVKFYSQFADVIVLARELTLKQIKKIVDGINEQKIKGPNGELVRVELFIHGALCVSISGKCYMSLANYNQSANRGKCLQSCRRTYRVIDDETGNELKIENKYVMSPKDLCTIKFLDKIIEAGVTVLKIEGRGRSPEYVYTTVKVYREAADSCLPGNDDKEKGGDKEEKSYNKKEKGDDKEKKSDEKERIEKWVKELETVYNRGFWHGGYYLGRKLGEWSGSYGSQATKRKMQIGTVKNYYAQKRIGLFLLESGKIKSGNEILIIGPTTGVVKCRIKSIFLDEKSVDSAQKGDLVTIPVPEKIRTNDKLSVLVETFKKKCNFKDINANNKL